MALVGAGGIGLEKSGREVGREEEEEEEGRMDPVRRG